MYLFNLDIRDFAIKSVVFEKSHFHSIVVDVLFKASHNIIMHLLLDLNDTVVVLGGVALAVIDCNLAASSDIVQL